MTHLLDVNVLLALSLSNHQHHDRAGAWFEAGVEWATTPLTESAYVRLMCNPAVVGYTIAVPDVLEALRAMRSASGHDFLADDSSLSDPVIGLGPLAGTKQVTDFHLLNLAVRNGLSFATFDGALLRALTADDRRHVHLISG